MLNRIKSEYWFYSCDKEGNINSKSMIQNSDVYKDYSEEDLPTKIIDHLTSIYNFGNPSI